MATNIELTAMITIVPNPDETFNLTCPTDHDFDRHSVSLADLRVEVANMFAEIDDRQADRFALPE